MCDCEKGCNTLKLDQMPNLVIEISINYNDNRVGEDKATMVDCVNMDGCTCDDCLEE